MPLDPLNLTREASINRAAIMDIPGVDLPADVRGQRAYDLLSAAAVCAAIKPHKATLGIKEYIADADLPSHLYFCLQSGNETIRERADSVAAVIGVRLGCLLLMLKRGDAINREARAEWDASYWAHWATMKHVIIGGGINTIVLGARIAHHAQNFLHENGFPDMTVERSKYSEVLPLVGAARCAPANATSAIVCDFGQTKVKRALALYQDDNAMAAFRRQAPVLEPTVSDFYRVLAGLLILAPMSSKCDTQDLYTAGDEVQARSRADYMERLIAGAVTFAEENGLFRYTRSDQLAVMCGLASYVEHGQPADRGCYGVLGLLSDNVEQYFADRLSSRFKRPVTFRLLHDGTAAAATYAGDKDTDVITMGTALGIGFPPPARGVHALAADFSVASSLYSAD